MPTSEVPQGCGHVATPDTGARGSIDALAAFFNIPTRDDFVLVITWLLASLRGTGPYPILAVSGEQGSSKTVFSKMLRAPFGAPVEAPSIRHLPFFIAAIRTL